MGENHTTPRLYYPPKATQSLRSDDRKKRKKRKKNLPSFSNDTEGKVWEKSAKIWTIVL